MDNRQEEKWNYGKKTRYVVWQMEGGGGDADKQKQKQ
jgi:hypothetical protein